MGRRERVSREEVRSARKGRKVVKHFVFPIFVVEGRNVGLPKAAVAEASGEMKDQKYSKIAHGCGAKHIRSRNVKNTSGAERFWKLKSRKSARNGGAKHMWKSKPAKHIK